MEALVQLRHPAVDAIVKERKCAVRLGLQGWGSVELWTESLGLWRGIGPSGAYWRTLAELMAHPAVHSVTFSGPWEPDGERERAAGDRDRWKSLGYTDTMVEHDDTRRILYTPPGEPHRDGLERRINVGGYEQVQLRDPDHERPV